MDGTGKRRGHLRLVGGRDMVPARNVREPAPFAVALFLAVAAGLGMGWLMPDRLAAPAYVHEAPGSVAPVHFSLCHTGGGLNCVVDGDTFYLNGEKIRIADIDAPETHPSRCESEAELGRRATLRLQTLLNESTVTLTASEDRDRDTYGRLLRTVERDGESLGGVLVNEGLARWYAGGRRTWC